MNELEALRAKVRARLSEQRYRHCAGLEEEGAKLARHWNADEMMVRTAALVHDITKEESLESQLKLCEKWGILVDKALRMSPELFHAVTGAAVAEHEFGLPEEICRIVRIHTVGAPAMTTVEKIVFLADYTEPGRHFAKDPPCVILRKLTYEDLDLAMVESLSNNIRDLISDKWPIYTQSTEAYNYYATLCIENGKHKNNIYL